MNSDVYQQKNKIILHIRDVGPFNSVWDVFLIIYDTFPVKVMFLSLFTTPFSFDGSFQCRIFNICDYELFLRFTSLGCHIV